MYSLGSLKRMVGLLAVALLVPGVTLIALAVLLRGPGWQGVAWRYYQQRADTQRIHESS
jgi:hypothetical protein